jgi:hypothetical protein
MSCRVGLTSVRGLVPHPQLSATSFTSDTDARAAPPQSDDSFATALSRDTLDSGWAGLGWAWLGLAGPEAQLRTAARQADAEGSPHTPSPSPAFQAVAAAAAEAIGALAAAVEARRSSLADAPLDAAEGAGSRKSSGQDSAATGSRRASPRNGSRRNSPRLGFNRKSSPRIAPSLDLDGAPEHGGVGLEGQRAGSTQSGQDSARRGAWGTATSSAAADASSMQPSQAAGLHEWLWSAAAGALGGVAASLPGGGARRWSPRGRISGAGVAPQGPPGEDDVEAALQGRPSVPRAEADSEAASGPQAAAAAAGPLAQPGSRPPSATPASPVGLSRLAASSFPHTQAARRSSGGPLSMAGRTGPPGLDGPLGQGRPTGRPASSSGSGAEAEPLPPSLRRCATTPSRPSIQHAVVALAPASAGASAMSASSRGRGVRSRRRLAATLASTSVGGAQPDNAPAAAWRPPAASGTPEGGSDGAVGAAAPLAGTLADLQVLTVDDVALGTASKESSLSLLLRVRCRGPPAMGGPSAFADLPMSAWMPYDQVAASAAGQEPLRRFLMSARWRQFRGSPQFAAYARDHRDSVPHLAPINEMSRGSLAAGSGTGNRTRARASVEGRPGPPRIALVSS